MDVSGNLWSCLKEVKQLFLYDAEHGMDLDPMQGKWASSRVNLGSIELLRIPAVTSESF